MHASLSPSLSLYIYMYTHMNIYIYNYIYIYIYIYIFVYLRGAGSPGGILFGCSWGLLPASKRTKRQRQAQTIKRRQNQNKSMFLGSRTMSWFPSPGSEGDPREIPGGSWSERSARDRERGVSTNYIYLCICISMCICICIYIYIFVWIFVQMYVDLP